MLVHQLARAALVAVTLLGQSVTTQKHCPNPSFHREWMSLPSHERAEWINAIKVKNPAGHSSHVTDASPCPGLNALPHNSSLKPTFDTNYAMIPRQ